MSNIHDIAGKFLTSIPADVFEKKQITELDASENDLKEVPEEVFSELPELQTLVLHTNKIETLPTVSRVACNNIAALALENNLLSALPPATFAQLSNLRRLTLQNNKFKKLPPVLFLLVKLTLLDMSENDLVDNDDWPSFAKLTNLQTLYLDANELKGIPQGLFHMKSLAKLSLKHNYVTNVPSGIAGLESLQELFLNNNKITKVPIHVYRLPKLRCVLLSGNPMDLNVKAKKSRIKAPKEEVRHSIKSPWDALGAPSLETASQSGADSGSKSQASASGSSISSLFGTSSLPQARRAASHTVKMGAPHYAGGVSNNRRQSSGHSKAQPAPLFVGRADASSSTEVSDEAAPPVDVEEDSSATEPDDTSQPMMVDAKMPALKLNSSTDQEPHPAANKPATSNVATQAKLNAMQHSGAASLSRAEDVDDSVSRGGAQSESDASLSMSASGKTLKKRGLKAKFGKLFTKKERKRSRHGLGGGDVTSDTEASMSTSATNSPMARTKPQLPLSNSNDSAASGVETGSSWTPARSPGRADTSAVTSPTQPEKTAPSPTASKTVSPRKKKRDDKEKSLSPRRRRQQEKAERAARRKSMKMEREHKHNKTHHKKGKASTLRDDQLHKDAGDLLSARSPRKTNSDPIAKDNADQAMYDNLSPDGKATRVAHMQQVSPKPIRPKSQFFVELQQDNDPVLQQVAIEETSDSIFVASAPVEALIKLLSHPWGFDALFQRQFLITMATFVQPLELIDMLAHRYRQNQPDPQDPTMTAERTAVRERVLALFEEWVELMPRSVVANRALRKSMLSFLKEAAETEANNDATLAQKASQLTDSVRTAMRAEAAVFSGAPGKSLTSSGTEAPRPYLPVNIQADSFATMSIFDLHPVELARQLTLVDQQLLSLAQNDEWIQCAWLGESALDDAPGIVALVNHFNNVSRWVSSEIVQSESIEQRTLLMKRFLLMANACAELRNYNGLMQILSGVEAFAVQRLRKTWAALPKQSQKLYEDLCNIVAMDDGDMARLRERMTAQQPPCVPYVGPYLAELQQIDESAPTFSETGDVNFEKLANKADVVLELKPFIDTKYNLIAVDFIQDYLNARQLLDDDELTKQSLIREPLRVAK